MYYLKNGEYFGLDYIADIIWMNKFIATQIQPQHNPQIHQPHIVIYYTYSNLYVTTTDGINGIQPYYYGITPLPENLMESNH